MENISCIFRRHTDIEGARLSSEISFTRPDLLLAEHWTNKPKVAGSNRSEARQISQPAQCGRTLRVTSLYILRLNTIFRAGGCYLQFPCG
jgi:hypothetical protein